jgi:segregation and condensation protein B
MEDVSLAVSLSDHPADAAELSENAPQDSAEQSRTTARARRSRAERHRSAESDVAPGDRPRKRRNAARSQTDMHADSDPTDTTIDAALSALASADEAAPSALASADDAAPADAVATPSIDVDIATVTEMSAEAAESPVVTDSPAADAAENGAPTTRRGRGARAGETRRRSARIVASKADPAPGGADLSAATDVVTDAASPAADTPADENVAAPVAEADSDADEPATIAPAVEALLFASDAPLSARKLAEFVGDAAASDIEQAVGILNERYAAAQMTFRIEAVAGGYQMMTLPEYQPWLARLDKHRADQRLGDAALETLAIIAYRQPIIRADIEAIRGVACGEVLSRLRELGLIRITGRAEVVGRPLLYGTTRKFLDMFGLAGLEDLPPMDGQPFRRMTPPADSPADTEPSADAAASESRTAAETGSPTSAVATESAPAEADATTASAPVSASVIASDS